MAKQFIITFERDMDDVSAGGFGLWLDMVLRNSVQDDPESDHGPFSVAFG